MGDWPCIRFGAIGFGVMARKLAYIIIECSTCGHQSKLNAIDLEDRIDDELTFDTVGGIFKRFICRSCRGRSIKVYDDSARLLIDSANLIPCQSCGDPILLPRTRAVPGTTMCSRCAIEASALPKPSPHPQPPADKTKCPRCGLPTIVRQNPETSDYFLGCTGFPTCRWTSPFDATGARMGATR